MKVINERASGVLTEVVVVKLTACAAASVKQSAPFGADAVNNESYGSLITDAWEDGICCQSGQVNQLIDQDVNKPRGASQRATCPAPRRFVLGHLRCFYTGPAGVSDTQIAVWCRVKSFLSTVAIHLVLIAEWDLCLRNWFCVSQVMTFRGIQY